MMDCMQQIGLVLSELFLSALSAPLIDVQPPAVGRCADRGALVVALLSSCPGRLAGLAHVSGPLPVAADRACPAGCVGEPCAMASNDGGAVAPPVKLKQAFSVRWSFRPPFFPAFFLPLF